MRGFRPVDFILIAVGAMFWILLMLGVIGRAA